MTLMVVDIFVQCPNKIIFKYLLQLRNSLQEQLTKNTIMKLKCLINIILTGKKYCIHDNNNTIKSILADSRSIVIYGIKDALVHNSKSTHHIMYIFSGQLSSSTNVLGLLIH